MKVHCISQYQYRPNFTQNDEWHEFGYDDAVSQGRRDFIRKWQEEHYFPYQQIYEKEPRQDEFELNQTLSELKRKPVVNIDDEKLMQIKITNFDQADVYNNIYRGSMIRDHEPDKIPLLYDAGIRRIINVAAYYGSKKLSGAAISNGMEYMSIRFSFDNAAFKTAEEVKSENLHFAKDIIGLNEEQTKKFVNKAIQCFEENSRIFIDSFVKYIQMMQKGNAFIGCEMGTYDTDTALMFNYLFNPQQNQVDNGLNNHNNLYLLAVENLYNKLTDSDKLKMNWPKDFDQTFFKRLDILKEETYRRYGRNISQEQALKAFFNKFNQ